MGSMSDRLLPMAPAPPPSPPIFERMAIVGLGLVGASIGLAARRQWPSGLVIGVDRNEVLEQAMRLHAIDVAAEELMIISEADLVILAAPVRENLRLLPELAQWVAGEAVVTDVGASKRAIVEAAAALPTRLPFVGGHPLAGAPRAGIEFARPDLFHGRPWLFTPPGGDSAAAALDRLLPFVTALGAEPRMLPSAAAHDHLVAFLSQLPQLAASGLMSVIGDEVGDEGLALAGRGLTDTTRLASSPAAAWRDVCATNADEIRTALDRLIAVLVDLREGLESGDPIERVFESAAKWREMLPRS
jgi:prephenate dehydrogenase